MTTANLTRIKSLEALALIPVATAWKLKLILQSIALHWWERKNRFEDDIRNLLITFQQFSVHNKIGECPCNVPNTRCVLEDNKCVCNEGFVQSPDKSRCIAETVHLGQSCEMNEQCVRFEKHAACEDGFCKCLNNFAQHDNTCRSLVKIGEHCESQAECRKFTTNVTCIDHKCACEKNFVASDNGNVSVECEKWNLCLTDSLFRCVCQTHFILKTANKTINANLGLDQAHYVITEYAPVTVTTGTSVITNEQFAREEFCTAINVKNIPIVSLTSVNRQWAVSSTNVAVVRATSFMMHTEKRAWKPVQVRARLFIILVT